MQSVTDMSPYVRKTAANAIPKLYRYAAALHLEMGVVHAVIGLLCVVVLILSKRNSWWK